MPFPPTPREIYRNNPLEGVIFQLRFPTILSIASAPPAQFQERIRGEYPWYETQSPAGLAADLPGVPQEIRQLIQGLEAPQTLVTHIFQTENHGRTVSLSQDAIAVHESEYREWRDFRVELQRAEEILNAIYAPAFYTRIGLRYRDVLSRQRYGLESVPWSQLLNANLLGILGSEEIDQAGVQQSRSQVMLTIPDVAGGQVALQHGLAPPEGDEQPSYIIDADFYTLHRCNSDDAFDAADKFNRWAGHLFRWAITDTLREKLQPHDS